MGFLLSEYLNLQWIDFMNKITANDAFKNAVIGTVPERKDEFELLWSENNVNVILSDDYYGFDLKSGVFDSIVYNHKTMTVCWVVGFCAQISFSALHEKIYSCKNTGHPLNIVNLYSDSIKQKIINGANLVKQLLDAEKFDNVKWVSDIPHPDMQKPNDVNGEMFFDISCMSMAFNILHELKHLSIKKDNENLTDHDEELACDDFAKHFIIDNIKDYSNSSGDDYSLVKNKRLMAIALSCSLFYMITPPSHWLGSETHPSISRRVKALFNSFDIADNDYASCYLSTSLLMVLFVFNIKVNELNVITLKSLSFNLLDKLDEFAINAK